MLNEQEHRCFHISTLYDDVHQLSNNPAVRVLQNNGRSFPLILIIRSCGEILFKLLIDYLLFYVPLKNVLLTHHHYRWRAAKFRPMLGAQVLWAGRNPHHATSATTQGLGSSYLIRRTAPFSRLLRHTRGYGESVLSRILMGPHSVASLTYDTQGDAEDLFLPGS
jgi:hypothetical protein